MANQGDEGTVPFEVSIAHGDTPQTIKVEVIDSPSGEAAAQTRLDAGSLLARQREIQNILLASAARTRAYQADREEEIKRIGRELFQALLGSTPVNARYESALALADSQEEKLRVVLRIADPKLASLPWETMYDDSIRSYVCRARHLVRRVSVPAPVAPLTVEPPLRILGLVSAPVELDTLETGRERQTVDDALAELTKLGLAEVSWLENATAASLQATLTGRDWHVVHYIGHGGFDPAQNEGVLLLVDGAGRSHPVRASVFADWLNLARRIPRLVVLNSCLGAAGSGHDLFASTAATLMTRRVSAVTAMQYEISDGAALDFTRGFYNALSLGRGVDEAVSGGRMAILNSNDQELEWVTPVLYLRGHQAMLFDIANASAAPAGKYDRDHEQSLPAKVTTEQATALSPAEPPEPTARLVRRLTVHTNRVTAVTFSPDGSQIATGSADRTARLWNVSTGRSSALSLNYNSFSVTSVAFSTSGTYLASGYDNGWLRFWSTSSGDQSGEIRVINSPLISVAFDKELVATGGTDDVKLMTGFGPDDKVKSLSLHHGLVRSVTFSADGKLLASGSEDGTARLWDAENNFEPVHRLPHRQGIKSVALNENGSLLVAACGNGAVVWDAIAGTEIGTLSANDEPVLGVAITLDGTLIATASRDGTARLWDRTSKREIAILDQHTGPVNAVAFSPDGTMLTTASDDGTAQLWTLTGSTEE